MTSPRHYTKIKFYMIEGREVEGAVDGEYDVDEIYKLLSTDKSEWVAIGRSKYCPKELVIRKTQISYISLDIVDALSVMETLGEVKLV